VERLDLVDRLACARIGETYNQYAGSPPLRERLGSYLEARREAGVVLVGEAAGYRGARVSGIPFTSERQLTGSGPAEATATIVHRVLAALGVGDEVLLWNVVPTHPGDETSNRRPTRAEVEAAAPFLDELTRGRVAIGVGRLAASVLDAPYVRHPSHGGAAEFEAGLRRSFATIGRRRAPVRPFL
jgi:uracil DNA glycosylase superfamily protein